MDRSAQTPAAGSAPPAVKSAEDPRSPLADGLPTPDVFGTSPGEWTGAKAARDTTLTGRPSEAAANAAGKRAAKRRVAPAVAVKTPRIERPEPSIDEESAVRGKDGGLGVDMTVDDRRTGQLDRLRGGLLAPLAHRTFHLPLTTRSLLLSHGGSLSGYSHTFIC